MKKFIYLMSALMLMSFSSLSYAASPCDTEKGYVKPQTNCQKPCAPQPKSTCEKTDIPACSDDCFLCTEKKAEALYKHLNLSGTQICTAEKLNDKYNTEVLSLNEQLGCEYDKKAALKNDCARKKEYRATKKRIKELRKEREKICKCYEKQFKAILSEPQEKKYKKYIKK